MEEIRTVALVARASEYRDNDRMLCLLTPMGRMDAIARGCRKMKSGLMSSCQPFTYAEFILKKNKDRLSIVAAERQESFFTVRTDYDKLTVASAMLELAAATMQQEEPSDDLFRLLYYSLSYLSYGNQEKEDLFIVFLLKFLQIQGYMPATRKCSCCGASTFEEGYFHNLLGALCASCAKQKGGKLISALSLEALYRMNHLEICDILRVSLPEEVQDELLRVLPAYLQTHMALSLKSEWFGQETKK